MVSPWFSLKFFIRQYAHMLDECNCGVANLAVPGDTSLRVAMHGVCFNDEFSNGNLMQYRKIFDHVKIITSKFRDKVNNPTLSQWPPIPSSSNNHCIKTIGPNRTKLQGTLLNSLFEM